MRLDCRHGDSRTALLAHPDGSVPPKPARPSATPLALAGRVGMEWAWARGTGDAASAQAPVRRLRSSGRLHPSSRRQSRRTPNRRRGPGPHRDGTSSSCRHRERHTYLRLGIPLKSCKRARVPPRKFQRRSLFRTLASRHQARRRLRRNRPRRWRSSSACTGPPHRRRSLRRSSRPRTQRR